MTLFATKAKKVLFVLVCLLIVGIGLRGLLELGVYTFITSDIYKGTVGIVDAHEILELGEQYEVELEMKSQNSYEFKATVPHGTIFPFGKLWSTDADWRWYVGTVFAGAAWLVVCGLGYTKLHLKIWP